MAKHELTEMQVRFCELYVECGNGRESAIGAGYSENSSSVQASKMLQMPKIKKYIAKLRREQGIDTTPDKELVQEQLLRLIMDEDAEPQHMLSAVDKLARLQGWFKDSTTLDINHNGGVDKLTDEELAKQMKQLQDELKKNGVE